MMSMENAVGPSGRPSVLFVDHSADPGGGQLGLLRYLANSREPNNSVLFLADGPIAAQVAAGGTTTVCLSEKPFRLLSILQSWRRLQSFLSSSGAEVVVANSLYAAAALALIPKRTGVKWIYYSRVSMQSLKGLKRLVAVGFIFRRFDAFLANSEWTASCIPSSLGDRRNIAVAYPVSGIPAAAIPRAAPACSGDTIRIVTLSRPDRWKGLDLLVEAVSSPSMKAHAHKVSVDMYGGSFFSDTGYLDELDALISASAVRIQRHDHVEDVSSVLRAADIVVLPTRMPEPFGQVVPQAMTHGCVVVVPDEGGPMEVVSDQEDGLVFQARSADSLSEVLLAILEGRTDAAKISSAAQDTSGSFADSITAGMLDRSILKLSGGL